jgi:putative DNA methylase
MQAVKGDFPTPAPSYRKKLIEVALPLEAINVASAREKSIRHGHPSTLHLWWARRPLAACRAVLFASIVDDPSSRPEEFPTEEAQETERQRLFRIIERLVLWENTNNEIVLNEARQEIMKATDGHPPPVLDPFCGGGSIPLEAQRLGLEAHGSDLNPVAVLITKALIEIPPKFAGQPPVNPEARKNMQKKIEGQDWPGASGLAEDVRYYGKWMRDEAEKRIGHLYPKARLADGSEATVIAWLWARTVKCPNPACGAMMPLLTSFVLSSKKGKEAYLIPRIDGKSLSFIIGSKPPESFGDPKRGMKRGMSGIFECILCGTITTRDYVSEEGKAKRIGVMPTAIVAQGSHERIYLTPDCAKFPKDISKVNKDGLEAEFSPNPRDVWCRNFGLNNPADLFSSRQLVALTSFSDLINEAWEHAFNDAKSAGLLDDRKGIAESGRGAQAYADGIATYLAMAIDRGANIWSSLSSWMSDRGAMRETFARQALPMVWDYAEANPFSDSGGNFTLFIERISDAIDYLPANIIGEARQHDAKTSENENYSSRLISTDPPYYDNIGYADLSDFFFVWLRRSLGKIFPDIFSTLLTPKNQELVALQYRFDGNMKDAERFFEDGLHKALIQIRKKQDARYPLTVYYAYKQAEEDKGNRGQASTGWEVMLDGLIRVGYTTTGTWPVRTESSGRSVAHNTNALASSIVLVCRPRPEDAPVATRREFLSALKRELPEALRQLQKGNIAPVDLAQAAIGPGMSIFSRYCKVLEANGEPMRVRTALQLINVHLDEYLSEQEGEYDADTRWALSWFEQYGMSEGPFGDAETLSKAKNTSVSGMIQAGILKAGAGRARLLKREEMDASWSPESDSRLTVWEATQYLILALESRGEGGAAVLLQKLGGRAQSARDLAYRLYSICERKSWSQEALAYNSLVMVWPRLSELSREKEAQRGLDSFGA